MKKILLALVFGLWVQAQSQVISFVENTTPIVTGSASDFMIDVPGHIVNNSDMPIEITWERQLMNMPQNWTVQICDINQCYLEFVGSESFFLGVGDTASIKVQFRPHQIAGTGDVKIVAKASYNNEEIEVELVYRAIAETPTGVSILNNSSFSMNLYPNPVVNTLNIDIYKPEAARIEIYNLTGKRIRNIDVREMSMVIDATNLPSGMYLVSVLDNWGNILDTKRFAKKG